MLLSQIKKKILFYQLQTFETHQLSYFQNEIIDQSTKISDYRTNRIEKSNVSMNDEMNYDCYRKTENLLVILVLYHAQPS